VDYRGGKVKRHFPVHFLQIPIATIAGDKEILFTRLETDAAAPWIIRALCFLSSFVGHPFAQLLLTFPKRA
jgi:hypothetical protein